MRVSLCTTVLGTDHRLVALARTLSLLADCCGCGDRGWLWLRGNADPDAGACIHTHSQHAVMATLLYGDVFEITHQEMIKGIRIDSTGARPDQARAAHPQETRTLSTLSTSPLSLCSCSGEYHKFYHLLRVPIIENTWQERDLTERMQEAMRRHPVPALAPSRTRARTRPTPLPHAELCVQGTSAVLVRRHGVYVWGPTWQKAKTMCECYDYLFEIAVKMKLAQMDPAEVPDSSEYKGRQLEGIPPVCRQ